MKIVSMAYTTPSVIARRKTVTRRTWKDSYARTFKAGDFLEAWSRSPRNKGKPIALIRLTADPVFEPVGVSKKTTRADFPPSVKYDPDVDRASDVVRLWNEEGFAYLDDLDGSLLAAARQWYDSGREYWTIRFEVLQVIDDSLDSRAERARCRDALLRFISQEVHE